MYQNFPIVEAIIYFEARSVEHMLKLMKDIRGTIRESCDYLLYGHARITVAANITADTATRNITRIPTNDRCIRSVICCTGVFPEEILETVLAEEFEYLSTHRENAQLLPIHIALIHHGAAPLLRFPKRDNYLVIEQFSLAQAARPDTISRGDCEMMKQFLQEKLFAQLSDKLAERIPSVFDTVTIPAQNAIDYS